jgi:c(7)-type cytochrome triheme protein
MTIVLLTLLPGLASMNGCGQATRQRLAAVFFEDVPPPGEERPPKAVVREPRRAPPARPGAPPPVAQAATPAPEPASPAAARDWRQVLSQLPRDASGEVDWVRALEDKRIEPKAGLDPSAPDLPVLSPDVERTPKHQPLFKAVFSHKPHTEWLACANCHPAIFPMRRGATPITMAKIFAGEYCGRCHGKVAFAVPAGCPRCHAALRGTP